MRTIGSQRQAPLPHHRPEARLFPAAALIALLACAPALLSGCGGGGAGPKASAGPPTVTTARVAGYGTVLATGSGTALYVLTADPKGGSRCAGACTAEWHPLLDRSAPTAGEGVHASLLSRFRRNDGDEQVLYNGHALYTYSGSGIAGGAGVSADGGIWFLVSPTGTPVEQTSSGGY